MDSGDPLVEVGGRDGAILCGGAAALGEVVNGEIEREDEDTGGKCHVGKASGVEGGEQLAWKVAVGDTGLGLVTHDAADKGAVGKVDGGSAEIGFDEGGPAAVGKDAMEFGERFVEVGNVDEKTLGPNRVEGVVGVGKRLDMPLLKADVEMCHFGATTRLGNKVRTEVASADLPSGESDAPKTKGLKTEAASGIEDVRTGPDSDAPAAELLELLQLLDLIEGFERGDVGAEVAGVRGGGKSLKRNSALRGVRHERISVLR